MKRRILIVEDNEINRKLLAMILQEEYEVTEAGDGVEAQKILEQESQNLSAVVLDLLMPRKNGIEVLQWMRTKENMQQLPVIVATGEDNKRLEEEALEAGANDYILKPYNQNILRNRLRNVIDLREKAAIVNAAKWDALTGLYSRAAFFEKAEKMIASRKPGYYVMACFDIERFKVVNDQYGTGRGDLVLKQIADAFRDGFPREETICCRVMADHFAVLYPESFMYTEKIQEIQRKATVLDGSILPITFSIGRYLVEDVTLTPSAMYDRAVLAKETVKGRYDEHIALYDESMRKKILDEQEIISEMNLALEQEQFEVWYQPQFNHATGALVGAEALVRWRHPVKGLISPGIFIPVFEKNGFVYEVDKYVWEQACRFIRKMQESGKRVIPVSVNISRYDIFREDLVEYLSGLVAKYQISVKLLRLEITESAFAKSGGQIIRVVKQLKELGFTMEIDDFGSGYSSLNTLKDVPADVLKLDMKFLEGEENSDKGGNIVESIIRMAKWIGMSVIAEGVETLEQADFLKTVGCYYIQGYFYSRPLPQADYELLMSQKTVEEEMAVLETVDVYDNEAFWDPKSLETIIFNHFVGAAAVFEYCDGKSEMIRANDKYVQILSAGVEQPREVFQFRWEDYMTPENCQRAYRAVESAIQTGREIVEKLELRGLKKNQKTVYVKINVRMIAHAGNRYLLYVVLEDITERMGAEERRKELLENLPCGAGIYEYADGELTSIYVNQRYWELVGRQEYDLTSYSAMEAVLLDDRDYLIHMIQEGIRHGGSQSGEIHIRNGQGKYLAFYVSGNIVERQEGKVLIYATYTLIEEDAITFRQMLPVALQTMMISSTDLLYIKDRSLHYVCASRAFAQMVGLSDESKVIGKTDYELFEQKYADKFRQEDQCMIREGSSLVDVVEELPLLESNGRYSSNSKYLLKDSEENIIGIYGISRDVTQSREAFERLQLLERENWSKYERERRLRREMVRSSVLYLQFNLTTGIIEEVYQKYQDQPLLKKGNRVDSELSQKLLEKINPEERESAYQTFFLQALQKAYECGETSLQSIYRRQMPDGEYHWVRMNVSILEKPDDGDGIVFLQCSDIDAEYKLKMVTERILDEDIESIVFVDIKSGMASIAHQKETMCHYHLPWTFEFKKECARYCRMMVVKEEQSAFGQFFDIDSLRKQLEVTGSVFENYNVCENGQTLRKVTKAYYLDDMRNVIVLTRRDITGAYQKEQEQKRILQEAAKKANAASLAKSDFLSHMSHDIRTPLNAVLAFSNHELTDTADEQKLREYLDKVNLSGEYLLGIVNDVLDMSKIEQKKIILRSEPYALEDFERTIRNVIDELSKERNIRFSMDISRNVTRCIMVDHVRFNQIFINLLSNAVKFTPRGGTVELLVEEYPQMQGDGIIKRLIVRDNGIGMKEDFIPHAFESFNQERRKEASERDKGTGLGLSIVKELVTLMGGTIRVESALNKGTTFTVEIPFEKSKVLDEIRPESITDYSRMKGMHILLAEDNAINREIAVTLLEKQGCIVDCAVNGEDACAKFESSRPEYYRLILMDIRMPIMDGLTATKQIRDMKRADAGTIPIVAMTADAFNEDEQTAFLAGMDMHIAKPFDPRVLYETCIRYVV